jgi:mannose-6-phosphate isomerase
LPDGAPIGESWDIVDRPEAVSVEPESGLSLREIVRRDPVGIMGPDFDPDRPFPILVKWLDCSQRLSLQVHPPADVAERLGGEPKTECWYIADASEDAALIVGLRRGVGRDAFDTAIREEALAPLLHRFAVRPGQAMLLESGRLHAIDAGNLILEIQQNSDTTYRVYDWGRRGLDGQPRDLHVDESLQSIDFNDFEPEPLGVMDRIGERVITDCAPFRIREFRMGKGDELAFESDQEPRILSVVRGALADRGKTATRISGGENALLPYNAAAHLTADCECTVLVTDRFA